MDKDSKLCKEGDGTVGQLVNRAARLLRRLADRRLAPFGLTAGTLPVLTALLPDGVLSQKALIEWAGIEQPTMAATLARMERDGLIERRTDPDDRRSSLFAPTAATRARAEAIGAAVQALNEEALASLGEADRAELRRLLRAVATATERLLDG